MSLSLAIIRFGQRLLGDGVLARALTRLGIADLLRRRRDRTVLRVGVYHAPLMGKTAKFHVTSRTELTHIDAFWREEALLRQMLTAVHEGDTVWDVGANIGLMSLALLLHAPDRLLSLHAFEPEPHNAAALRRNIEANGIMGAIVHEVALGDRTGEATLHIEDNAGGGSHSLVRKTGRAITVTQQTADALAASIGMPDVMKIDVEGAELAVLHGMRQLLSQRCVRELFIELHPTLMPERDLGPQLLHDLLRSHGYERVWHHRRGSEQHVHYRSA